MMNSKIRVAIVDDFSNNTIHLFFQLLKMNEIIPVIYGPKKQPVGKFSINKTFKFGSKVWSSFFYPFQIFKKTYKDKPDILHLKLELNTFGFHFMAMFFPFLLLLLRLTRSAIITEIHTVIPISLIKTESFRIIVPRYARFLSKLPGAYQLLLMALYCPVIKLSDAIVVHSSVHKRWLSYYLLKERDDKITIVPQGVKYEKTEKNEPSHESNRPAEKMTIVYFGSITPLKGVHVLLQAFYYFVKDFPASQLIIVGGVQPYHVDYARKIKAFIAKNYRLRESIVLKGWINEEEASSILSAADLIVFPYVFPASASGTLAVAKRFKHLKIIGSDIDILRDQISSMNNAFLCKPGDPFSLYNKLRTAVTTHKSNPTFLYEPKSENDSWERVAKIFASLYYARASKTSLSRLTKH